MKITTTQTLIAIGLLCFSASSMAQWQWVDRSGRKVFSDQPPPADISERNILKRPGVGSTPVSMASGNEEKASASAQTASAAPSAPEQSKEEKAKEEAQRKDEEAKRKAEEAKIAQAKKENCTRARTALSTLQSGIRIRTVDAKGQHSIMDDKARAAEEARIRKDIAENC